MHQLFALASVFQKQSLSLLCSFLTLLSNLFYRSVAPLGLLAAKLPPIQPFKSLTFLLHSQCFYTPTQNTKLETRTNKPFHHSTLLPNAQCPLPFALTHHILLSLCFITEKTIKTLRYENSIDWIRKNGKRD